MEVKVDPQNVENWHWWKSNSSSKKAIIKLSTRKDAEKKKNPARSKEN